MATFSNPAQPVVEVPASHGLLDQSSTPLDEAMIRKRDVLLSVLHAYGRVAVAFSAGVDSTVVAKAARLACGDDAVAITAVSPSLPEGERDESERLAAAIGIRHQFIDTNEFQQADYLRNDGTRCFHCKTELYTQLETLLPQLQTDVIVNGANLDDANDYRPGMQAAKEHGVRSPLIEANLSKKDVRALARFWALPNWDKPAGPCLSSRIAYGVEVTPRRVGRVDRAELYLRGELGLREVRVRHEANDLARIEVPQADISRFLDSDVRTKVTSYLHSLGFKYVTVDLDGFRSGSMNAALPLKSLTVLGELDHTS